MENNNPLFEYVIRMADNALIIGHRLSEWCGHGPMLETDIGMTNIALDLVGHARSLYQYAAKVEGKGRTEDDLAYLRDVREYKNLLICEQLNGSFANTMARQFLFDTFNYYFYSLLRESKDSQLVAIADKGIKELSYHFRYSAEWIIRMGDGTEESHQKIQDAIDIIWTYTEEMFDMDGVDEELLKEGIAVDLAAVKSLWEKRVHDVLTEATLNIPETGWQRKGGKKGVHTEHMGFLLAELQYMQRAYPNCEW